MSSPSWSPYARYGDFLSAQMKSLRKFGYGMFVCTMQAAQGPSCSTFWLYSDAPAPGCMPEIAQLWRWNEFDFEFVPQTQATQNSYITVSGSFPNPTVTFYGSQLDWSSMTSGQITPDVVNWVEGQAMTDDFVFGQMQQYYNSWMVPDTPDAQIASDDYDFAGAVATTGPDNQIGGTGGGSPSEPAPGWPNASVWKYPLTAVKPTPENLPLDTMLAINWWRMPAGDQSLQVSLPGFVDTQTYDYIVKQTPMDGSTAAESAVAAALNNETYVFPDGISWNPYTSLNTYTLVWTPESVTFYVNAPENGTAIDQATPIARYLLADYPSLAQSGEQAPQGKTPWVDTTIQDLLGDVSINLANYVAFTAAANEANDQLTPSQEAGAGWSGDPPPDSGWAGDQALFRRVQWYPLTNDSPAQFDFDNGWGFDFSDGTWTAENFPTRIGEFFGILYAQDFTNQGGGGSYPLYDSKSPLAVTFGTDANDNLPVMILSCAPSSASPTRNFFVVNMTMNTGVPISTSNPFMFATVSLGGSPATPSVAVSGASTPLSFFAPAAGESTTATISLYLSATYHGSFPPGHVPSSPNATATLTLSTASDGTLSWSIVDDADGIVSAFQSANPWIITIQPGSASFT